MPQSFASLHVHIIFSTKNREPFLSPDIETRLYEYIGGILRADGASLIAAGGMPDHIHLLISLTRDHSLAGVARLIKANSSKWIHETFPAKQAFAWQVGYGAFSVSYSNIDSVKRYIAGQSEHHRKKTFQGGVCRVFGPARD